MNSSSKEPEIFNILCLGQRGVGKTVFLAGSYAELLSQEESNSEQFWFDCQDTQAEKHLQSIFNYVAQNGEYPPPTLKITSFNFSLKSRRRRQTKTLCQFRWWDIPGEICQIEHPDFQKMALSSHSCCMFINGYALVHQPTYLQELEETIRQVVAIASLVNQHNLNYRFAVVFTQCDRLGAGPVSQLQIEKHLQPVTERLDAAKANYQKFYSAIPIIAQADTFRLNPSGAAQPLLWLLSQLTSRAVQSPLGSGLEQKPAAHFQSTRLPKNTLIGLASASLVAIVALLGIGLLSQRPELQADEPVSKYQQVLQVDPNNTDALLNLANLYLDRGQSEKAIPLMEKVVAQNPENVDLHFNLAKIYELTGHQQKAEAVYDQVLAQQENDLRALLGKAILRSEQGDTQMAKSLFAQAEAAAPTGDLKARVRALAENALTPVP